MYRRRVLLLALLLLLALALLHLDRGDGPYPARDRQEFCALTASCEPLRSGLLQAHCQGSTSDSATTVARRQDTTPP